MPPLMRPQGFRLVNVLKTYFDKELQLITTHETVISKLTAGEYKELIPLEVRTFSLPVASLHPACRHLTTSSWQQPRRHARRSVTG